jgi:hypothetical protein
MASAGAMEGFIAAVDALPDASLDELAFLHPMTVRTKYYYIRSYHAYIGVK